jgi:hypothetical protein
MSTTIFIWFISPGSPPGEVKASTCLITIVNSVTEIQQAISNNDTLYRTLNTDVVHCYMDLTGAECQPPIPTMVPITEEFLQQKRNVAFQIKTYEKKIRHKLECEKGVLPEGCDGWAALMEIVGRLETAATMQTSSQSLSSLHRPPSASATIPKKVASAGIGDLLTSQTSPPRQAPPPPPPVTSSVREFPTLTTSYNSDINDWDEKKKAREYEKDSHGAVEMVKLASELEAAQNEIQVYYNAFSEAKEVVDKQKAEIKALKDNVTTYAADAVAACKETSTAQEVIAEQREILGQKDIELEKLRSELERSQANVERLQNLEHECSEQAKELDDLRARVYATDYQATNGSNMSVAPPPHAPMVQNISNGQPQMTFTNALYDMTNNRISHLERELATALARTTLTDSSFNNTTVIDTRLQADKEAHICQDLTELGNRLCALEYAMTVKNEEVAKLTSKVEAHSEVFEKMQNMFKLSADIS